MLSQILSGRVLKKYKLMRYASVKTGLSKNKLACVRSKNVSKFFAKKKNKFVGHGKNFLIFILMTHETNLIIIQIKKGLC